MANKKSDSIDENAFQALEAALSIDFDGDEAPALPSPGRKTRGPEAPLSDNSQRPVSKKPIDRRSARAAELGPEPAPPQPRSPSLAPANDGSRRAPSAMLKSLEAASLKTALRNASIVSVLWILGAVVFPSFSMVRPSGSLHPWPISSPCRAWLRSLSGPCSRSCSSSPLPS